MRQGVFVVCVTCTRAGAWNVWNVWNILCAAMVSAFRGGLERLERLERHSSPLSACLNSKKQSVSHWDWVLSGGQTADGGVMVASGFVLPM